jgi:hypothetical protein
MSPGPTPTVEDVRDAIEEDGRVEILEELRSAD